MKSLEVATEEASFTAEALDKYATVFSNPLSATQIKALVALFGWSPPSDHDEVGLVPNSKGL
jgi:hypothetical protein